MDKGDPPEDSADDLDAETILSMMLIQTTKKSNRDHLLVKNDQNQCVYTFTRSSME